MCRRGYEEARCCVAPQQAPRQGDLSCVPRDESAHVTLRPPHPPSLARKGTCSQVVPAGSVPAGSNLLAPQTRFCARVNPSMGLQTATERSVAGAVEAGTCQRELVVGELISGRGVAAATSRQASDAAPLSSLSPPRPPGARRCAPTVAFAAWSPCLLARAVVVKKAAAHRHSALALLRAPARALCLARRLCAGPSRQKR